MNGKRTASAGDLQSYAQYLRDLGHREIVVYSGVPGEIRFGRKIPKGITTYCIVGHTGRVWRFVNAEN